MAMNSQPLMARNLVLLSVNFKITKRNNQQLNTTYKREIPNKIGFLIRIILMIQHLILDREVKDLFCCQNIVDS